MKERIKNMSMRTKILIVLQLICGLSMITLGIMEGSLSDIVIGVLLLTCIANEIVIEKLEEEIKLNEEIIVYQNKAIKVLLGEKLLKKREEKKGEKLK